MRNHKAELAANLGFRVDNGRLEYNGVPRPATPEESLLWGELLNARVLIARMTDLAAESDVRNRERNAALAAAEADVASLKASCEAYRQELEKLRVYALANFVSPEPPTEQVPTLEIFAAIVQSHNAQKKRLLDKAREIWKIEPGTDIIDFMFRRLQDMNGEMYVETERRRAEYVNRPKDAANADMQEYLDNLHGRVAGTRAVRDNPQA